MMIWSTQNTDAALAICPIFRVLLRRSLASIVSDDGIIKDSDLGFIGG